MKFITQTKSIQPIHIIGLYVIIYLCLLPFYQYQINPDAVAYIACAQKYANGDFYQALNGYWSPLLCWLLVPFIKTGIEPLLSIKIINLLFSSLAFLVIHNLAKQYIAQTIYITCLLFVCIPHLLIQSLTASTPDIISLALLLLLLLKVLVLIHSPTSSNVLGTGILGALSYAAKYYNFYGVMLMLIITGAYCILHRKKISLKYICIAAMIFLSLSVVWMLAIYTKYGVLAPTTASSFNINLLGQSAPYYPFLIGTDLLPLDYNQYRFTSWEDPFYYHLPKWNPLRDVGLWSKKITTNIHTLILSYWMELLAGAFATGLLITKRKTLTPPLFLMLAIAVIYPLGYVFTLLESRYLLFSIVLALVLFFTIVDQYNGGKSVKGVILLFTALLVVIQVYKMPNILDGNKYYFSFKLQYSFILASRNTNIICSRGTWADALYYSYFENKKLYDTINPDRIDSAFISSHPNLDLYFCRQNEIPEIFGKESAILRTGEYAIISLKGDAWEQISY